MAFQKINYPINEISNKTSSQLCTLYNSKTHNTVHCRLRIKRSRPQKTCNSCGDNHLVKDSPKCKKAIREPSPNSTQNHSIHATSSVNTYILFKMSKSISDQLEAPKLDDTRLTKYMKKQSSKEN